MIKEIRISEDRVITIDKCGKIEFIDHSIFANMFKGRGVNLNDVILVYMNSTAFKDKSMANVESIVRNTEYGAIRLDEIDFLGIPKKLKWLIPKSIPDMVIIKNEI